MLAAPPTGVGGVHADHGDAAAGGDAGPETIGTPSPLATRPSGEIHSTRRLTNTLSLTITQYAANSWQLVSVCLRPVRWESEATRRWLRHTITAFGASSCTRSASCRPRGDSVCG
jgi:hypothetical protein